MLPHLNLGDEDLHLARIVLTQGKAGILEHDQHQLQVLGLEAVGQPGQQVVDQLGAHNPKASVSDPYSLNPDPAKNKNLIPDFGSVSKQFLNTHHLELISVAEPKLFIFGSGSSSSYTAIYRYSIAT